MIRISVTDEMLGDIPAPATPDEMKAAHARHADLKERGLLSDDGREIRLTDCPAVYYAGHEGDETFPCEKSRGHDDDHGYELSWS